LFQITKCLIEEEIRDFSIEKNENKSAVKKMLIEILKVKSSVDTLWCSMSKMLLLF